MIDIDIKSKAFGSHHVLGEISFSIPTGQTVALHGPSGIGKSTLLNIVAGLDQDYRGKVQKPDRVAMVFQEPTLLPWRTVMQNILLVSGADETAVCEILDRLGLLEKRKHFPDQLSLGQRRRLSLARAFAPKPDFLIMDEPYTSLDGKLVDEMLSLTRELIEYFKMTTLFVTHSGKEAAFLADEIYELSGAPAQLNKL